MAHFAKLGINNTVMAVTPLEDKFCKNADDVVDETVGQQYLERVHGWPSDLWIQCSYNTHKGVHWTRTDSGMVQSEDQSKAFRGNFPSKGWIWDQENNIFYRPRPHASWTLNKTTAAWESPVAIPSITVTADNTVIEYMWDEVNTRWQTIDNTKYWNESASTWDNI
jgi:hypothetical protein